MLSQYHNSPISKTPRFGRVQAAFLGLVALAVSGCTGSRQGGIAQPATDFEPSTASSSALPQITTPTNPPWQSSIENAPPPKFSWAVLEDSSEIVPAKFSDGRKVDRQFVLQLGVGNYASSDEVTGTGYGSVARESVQGFLGKNGVCINKAHGSLWVTLLQTAATDGSGVHPANLGLPLADPQMKIASMTVTYSLRGATKTATVLGTGIAAKPTPNEGSAVDDHADFTFPTGATPLKVAMVIESAVTDQAQPPIPTALVIVSADIKTAGLC